MGADFYEDQEQLANTSPDQPRIGIGQGAMIQGALIDKNCRIGDGAQICPGDHPDERLLDENCMIRDGIVVVRKGSLIPRGWKC